SRTPLREAIAQLEHEGLVTVQPRRGVFIVRKTKADILEMVTVWAALESIAAGLATEIASDQQIAALNDLVEAVADDEIAERMGEYSDANIRFHQAIIGLGQSALISRLTDDLFPHVRAIRRRTIFERDRATRSITDHREIVAAIASRDRDRAERLVRAHTLKLHDHLEQYVDLEFAEARTGAA
ncbi:MAG: GntR family transcriptional regulator, partial [Pseudomonadota bacterium]